VRASVSPAQPPYRSRPQEAVLNPASTPGIIESSCSRNLLGQSVIYELLPQARSRLTAIYMTTMFVGGAIGSLAASHAYER
jgi:hypothetical protein